METIPDNEALALIPLGSLRMTWSRSSRSSLRGAIERAPQPAKATSPAGLTPEDVADQDLQRRLLAAGIISEIKPPITDMAPYQNRRAVPIEGEPLSETVIRERRWRWRRIFSIPAPS
jgi:hypothetical protein